MHPRDLQPAPRTSYNTIADGQVIAVHTIDQSGSAYTDYLHYDHLGSVDAITNDSGSVIQTMSFDAFGLRRDATNWDYDLSQNTIATLKNYTDRGYTDQEELDNLSLVDLNGRVYDPAVGRMISADPTVPDSRFSQAFNRFAYVYDSPLDYTDPTGFVCQANTGTEVCEEMDGGGAGYQLDSSGNPVSGGSGGDNNQAVIPLPKVSCDYPKNCPVWPPLVPNVCWSCFSSGGDLLPIPDLGTISSGQQNQDSTGGNRNNSKQPPQQRQPSKISCGTALPDKSTVGSHVNSISNQINNSVQLIPTPYGPVILEGAWSDPLTIMSTVYNGTNFRAQYGDPGANYQFLGDAGNFAYGAVSKNIGVPESIAEAVAGGYAFLTHPASDQVGPFGMDISATVEIPAGYKATCTN